MGLIRILKVFHVTTCFCWRNLALEGCWHPKSVPFHTKMKGMVLLVIWIQGRGTNQNASQTGGIRYVLMPYISWRGLWDIGTRSNKLASAGHLFPCIWMHLTKLILCKIQGEMLWNKHSLTIHLPFEVGDSQRQTWKITCLYSRDCNLCN